MFNSISQPVLERMQYLEQIDRQDRSDGTSRRQRLRQIPPETGRFLALLAANAPEGRYIEIGTSAGYSTLWIALACQMLGRTITTFEILAEKAQLARETFRTAGLQNLVNLVEGDFLAYPGQIDQISFCFLDAEKEVYSDCYEAVIPKLVAGGFLIADNAISHQDDLEPFIGRALADPRVDGLVVPIGKGELICRKV